MGVPLYAQVPTTPSAAIENANAGSATITGLDSAESGLVNEAEECTNLNHCN
jgi:hypothetical protein